MKDKYIIPPDEARRLNAEEYFVIAQGYDYKVYTAPVHINAASLEQAQVYIEQQAHKKHIQVSIPTGILWNRGIASGFGRVS
jgi:hypothetical protein